ncbi:MAG: homoserine O-acetyltransferase [Bacteroidales bacterium]
MKPKSFFHKGSFPLESGEELPSLHIAYQTYGRLNEAGDNVIWICHALTASADAHLWWPGLVGEGKTFDPDHHFIVCANIIGSSYGTTGPLSADPRTGLPWYRSFPDITIRDAVRAHDLLREHLGIACIHTLIGGSIGAFQALEYSILFPDRVRNLIFVAGSVKISPWATALNQSQRLAIEADASYGEDRPFGGSAGLKAARSMALLSYRNDRAYNDTQQERDESKTKNLPAATYQNHQGEKLLRRFDAYSYHLLTRMMDTHNVIRDRGSLGEALGRIRARILAIGIAGDRLFPPEEVKLLAHVCQQEYAEIESPYGHDGFLLESEQLAGIIKGFRDRHPGARPGSRQRTVDLAWAQSA